MNQETENTINHFFDLEETLSEANLEKLEKESKFQEMRRKIKAQAKGVTLPSDFFRLVLIQLLDLFDIKIPQLLTHIWSQQAELAKYTDAEEYPADKTFFVPLLAHTFESEHTPYIEPMLNKLPLGRIKAKAVFTLNIEGAMLKIRNGYIEGFTLGDCTGGGSIEVIGVPLVEKETSPWRIPATITLAQPIKLTSGQDESAD